MDFNYDNQNQPSDQQQQPDHLHQPGMSNFLQQHLQLQPTLQQHDSFLQSHHHNSHPNQGGQVGPFLPRWGSPGFGPIPGEGGLEGLTERNLMQQDGLLRSTSNLPQVEDTGQVLRNLLSPVVEQGTIVDPRCDHIVTSTITPTRFSQPTESTRRQPPSNSITTPMQPNKSSSRSLVTAPTQPTRHPLTEKQPLTDRHENLQRNTGQHGGQVGTSKKTTLHAKLPEGFNYQFADETNRIIGVVVKRVIQKGQWFGPFNGALLGEEDGLEIGSTWEICLRGKVKFYVDARSKIHNNWLYHINPARTTKEQNLEAFQHYGDIYFRALDIIQPGTELKVFYSDEYREKIGCKIKLDDLDYDKEADCFKCPWCEETYQTSKIILRHIKFTHTNSTDQTVNMSSNLEESHTKKARLMEAEKQPSRENSSFTPPERAGSNKPKKSSREEGCFVCVICGSRFPTSGRLLAHERFHESTIDRFECDLCDAVFKTTLSLVRHKKSHGGLHYRCSLCSKMYSSRSHLSRHMNTAHGFMRSKGQIICTGCSRSFCLEYDMMEHLQSCKGLQRQIKNIQVFMSVNDESFIPYDKFGSDAPNVAPRENSLPPLPLPRHDESETNSTKKCSICHKAYTSRSHLSRHMHTKHGFGRSNGNIVCMGCSKTFFLEEDMSQHFIQCTGSQGFMMRGEERRPEELVEDFVFLPNDKEGISNISKPIEDPIQANVQGSNEDFTKRYSLEDGIGLLPEGNTMQAREQACSQSGDNNLNEKQALVDCTQKKGEDRKRRIVDMLGARMGQVQTIPFKCCYCRKRFSTKSRLNRHKWEKHPNCSVHKCDHCDKTFPSRCRLKTHLYSHSKDKHYKCQQCPRSFASENALSNHMKEHTEARPHKCETCTKGFKTQWSLKEHKWRVHSNRQLSFECSICNKKFAEKHYLFMHERRHTGLRPHVCGTCGKAFTTKFSLTNHNRIHTGERPFKCHVCEKTFALNHHLNDHLFSIHSQTAKSKTKVQESTSS